jgi:multisubunit Na+/H+ antiporter MnhG subunit
MTGWHIRTELMSAYLDGSLDPASVMSVEAHLTGCGQCRSGVPVDEVWLADSWAGIEDVVDRPHRSQVERLLVRAGVPDQLARLVLATPTLCRAWLLAVIGVLALAVGAVALSGGNDVALLIFLVTAPVLPLAGVAAAYGRTVDPAYELHAATPVAGYRLLLVRATAVLVAATLLTGLAIPWLPGPAGLSTAWLLPSLMLTLATLAVGTRFPLPTAAAVLGGLWLTAVLSTQNVDRFLVFQSSAQFGYALAALAFCLVLHRRRRHLDPGESTWESQSA